MHGGWVGDGGGGDGESAVWSTFTIANNIVYRLDRNAFVQCRGKVSNKNNWFLLLVPSFYSEERERTVGRYWFVWNCDIFTQHNFIFFFIERVRLQPQKQQQQE